MTPAGPATAVASTPVASALARLALGAVAGLAAAVVMDLPMSRQPEGFTPAYVAASVLRRRSPDAVAFRDASVVHHGAGLLAGVLYGLLYVALDTVAPVGVPVAGVDVLAHAVAVVAVVLFIYAFFAHLVLPRAGGTIYEERATAVRGQWLRSSLVFGAALGVVAPLLFSVA
jgi:hypothetical protein